MKQVYDKPRSGIVLLAVLVGVALMPAAALAQVAARVGDGVYRFDADAEAKALALPSFSFEDPHRREAAEALATRPTGVPSPKFERIDGKVRVTVPIEPGTNLYGTGEVAGPLLRNGRTVVCWNTDAYGYGDDAPSLYKSHPWVLGLRADGTSFGVLADTTYKTEIDLTGDIVFTADGPAFPVIVIDKAHPRDVVIALADLTGTMAMPPIWALGYNQCRYSYNPDSRVREIARGFRDRNIPADVIWMDIDYMDGFRCFTWDQSQFPDPKGLNDDLHGWGFKTVWMIDPGIKAEKGYFVYDQGTAADAWVQKPDGSVYNGDVWPGSCVFPDYTREATRTWWAGLYKDFMATGIDGVWNDMNEPAVFNVPSKTMPEDNLHRADAALGGPAPHARFHNVYGMLMVKASREGIMAANPDKRPFVLSRASFIGGQRYGASWTGDNSADWYHLESSIPMVLNMGLSGQPFTGPDIGGFAGNGPPGQEAQLFARWMGIGALMPFSRGHTGKGNIDKEPWSFGPEVEKTCRLAIERRYRLMPYLYTLFHEATVNGLPVARPLFFADPKDPALRSEDDAFLLGDDLMVVGSLVPDRSRVPALPAAGWAKFDFGDGADADLPALYIREGSIIPTGPVMQHTREKPLDPLTLLVCLDREGQAVGTLYEDAGEGFGYQKGEYALTKFRAVRNGDAIDVSVVDSRGQMKKPARKMVVRVIEGGGNR
jgi:alpha-glucosidase